MGDKELTEAEAAVYDRQLRVWGVDTQKRLSSAKVLIAGCTGLAAEVAKNIVLAGVGSLTLVDDTPLAQAPHGTFLAIPGGAEHTVAEACMATLQEMNPLVSVKSLPGAPTSTLPILKDFDIALLFNQPAGVAAEADELCRASGTPLFVAACRGIFGWAFADLQEHAHIVEVMRDQEDGTSVKVAEQRSASYPSWEDAMSCSTSGMNLRRTPALYFVLRVVSLFEREAGRLAGEGDLPALLEAKARLLAEQGLPASAVDDRALESYAADSEGMPAISAVVGGVLANEVLKAVSKKGDPLQNFFLYSLADGAGAVARMPPA